MKTKNLQYAHEHNMLNLKRRKVGKEKKGTRHCYFCSFSGENFGRVKAEICQDFNLRSIDSYITFKNFEIDLERNSMK